MGLLGRLKRELQTAGDAAKDALDEGKVRIEIFRVRQSADAAAQALGYAVHRARRDGKEIEPDALKRLDDVLATHEADAERLQRELARHRGETPPAPSDKGDDPDGGDPRPGEPPKPDAPPAG
ncbi:MAG: hypothetical protein FJ202_04605 [Gemmatimonadetes bacterium]|nr:hypothetical protein [Gemmatimonadota bacterium]